MRRTNLYLPDALMEAALIEAVRRRTSVSAMVTDLLRNKLASAGSDQAQA